MFDRMDIAFLIPPASPHPRPMRAFGECGEGNDSTLAAFHSASTGGYQVRDAQGGHQPALRFFGGPFWRNGAARQPHRQRVPPVRPGGLRRRHLLRVFPPNDPPLVKEICVGCSLRLAVPLRQVKEGSACCLCPVSSHPSPWRCVFVAQAPLSSKKAIKLAFVAIAPACLEPSLQAV